MPDRAARYFWDGNQNLSPRFQVVRMIEYASFPDLINFPFDMVKSFINDIDVERLRTSEKRKRFIARAKRFIGSSERWEEVVEKMIV
jgi:hypothetical protein